LIYPGESDFHLDVETFDYPDKEHFKCHVQIYYRPDNIDYFDEKIAPLIHSIEKQRIPYPPEAVFFLITQHPHGFDLTETKLAHFEFALENNYNEDLVDLHPYLIEKLTTKGGKGLLLLHGAPGTGKTNYIRFLITELYKFKKVIYMPPDLSGAISNPQFIPFLLNNKNSVLIIEDAENVIKSRKAGANQSVSNLLNLSDGLLSDGLRIQLVCTFNADVNELDDALLRKGRLIARYEFKKLELEKSKKLSDQLGINSEWINEPKTLAEIYHHNDLSFISKRETLIGFKK
jgi:hypothetical protein